MKFTGQGKRLLFDPDDRPLDPLLGEPAANCGDELSNVSWRRRPLVVDIPCAIALFVDSATLAS
jgi:hypothetical protein